MSRPPPEPAELVVRLLGGGEGGRTTRERLEAGHLVLPVMAERMGRVVGAGGFQMILQRALTRTQIAHPWLPTAPLALRDGGLAESAREVSPDEALQALSAVLEEVLSLMGRFLGVDIVVRLLGQSFPEIMDSDTGSGSEESIP